MTDREFSPEALRAALQAAERNIRLNWIEIIGLAALQALILGYALKVADFGNPTHELIFLAAAWSFAHLHFVLSLVVRRQDAANARMLRALELVHEKLPEE